MNFSKFQRQHRRYTEIEVLIKELKTKFGDCYIPPEEMVGGEREGLVFLGMIYRKNHRMIGEKIWIEEERTFNRRH